VKGSGADPGSWQSACRWRESCRLPLLSTRPAVTPETLKRVATNFAAWWTEAQCVWTSGVARNFRQGVRQSVAFLSVLSRSAALPSRSYNQKMSWHIIPPEWLNEQCQHYNTEKSHTKKYVFPDAPYSTCMATPLVWAVCLRLLPDSVVAAILNVCLSAPESNVRSRLPSHQKNFAIAKKSHVSDSGSDFSNCFRMPLTCSLFAINV